MANCEDSKLEERVRALETRDAITQTQYANIMTTLVKLDAAIEDLKAKPGKQWENVVEKVIMLILAGVVGAVLSNIGIG